MILYDGYKESKVLDEKIKEIIKDTNSVVDKGELAIIQVGDDSSSNKYILIKQKVGVDLGIQTKLFKFPAEISIENLKKEVSRIVNRGEIKSVIVQLPLPNKNMNPLLDLVPSSKDVDVLSSYSQASFYGDTLGYGTPVTRATEYVMSKLKFLPENTKVLVVGTGFLVGNPVIQMLKTKNYDIKVTENFTKKDAIGRNLVILSAGVAGLVKGEDLLPGTNVIDFGSSVVNGITFGDLDMSSNLSHLGRVVPSPKGMGPLVVRFLFLNHLKIFSI